MAKNQVPKPKEPTAPKPEVKPVDQTPQEHPQEQTPQVEETVKDQAPQESPKEQIKLDDVPAIQKVEEMEEEPFDSLKAKAIARNKAREADSERLLKEQLTKAETETESDSLSIS